MIKLYIYDVENVLFLAYINEMKKHLTIHIYGKCGAPCPGSIEEDCLEYLSNYYAFILVFETHVCQHYISPQLLKVLNLKKTSMVPVVFGGINYNELFTNNLFEINSYLSEHNRISTENLHNKYFPRMDNIVSQGNKILSKDSNAFVIDALGQSPRALAHYLKHLVKNRSSERQQSDNLNKYLKWRHMYKLNMKEWPCILCEKLRKEAMEKKRTQGSRKDSIGNRHKPKSSELCTSWPKLNFGRGK